MQYRKDRINVEIMENELASTDWEMNCLCWELYWWVDFFNIAFFREQPVPIPALTFERTRVNNLGYYRIGFNDFAVKDQINLNRLYIKRPLAEVLTTLVHEMVHSFENLYVPIEKRTKSWYHTKAFRDKMAEIGILTDEKGCHTAVGDPFVHLLGRHAVKFPAKKRNRSGVIVVPPVPKAIGKSKLKKWQCPCGQNARVGKREFHAVCSLCHGEFTLSGQ